MLLRDHSHPPLSRKSPHQEFHGVWPLVFVQQLRRLLPSNFIAGPHVPVGTQVEVQTELGDFDEYEVHVYDAQRDRQLVAAIELISPANKDRPDARSQFVAKCVA
jgi:hypothetical protein